jgi:hypothetical protein
VANELAGIKTIQGQARVRIILGAKQHEIEAVACSAIDLRLAPTSLPGSIDVAPVRPLAGRRGGDLQPHQSLGLDLGCRMSSWLKSAVWQACNNMTRCVKQWKISGASDAFTDKIILRIKSREQLQLHGAQQQAKELMMVIARGCPEW